MNEERIGKCLRQVEHIRGHKYFGQLSHGGRTTFEVMTPASLLAEALYQENPNMTM